MLAEPFLLGGREVVARASIGIAIQTADGEDADELLRHADIAMYAAKGRGGDCVISPTSRSSTTRPWPAWSSKRTSAARSERGELCVAYQPIVDLETGAITGSRPYALGASGARRDPADRVHPAGRGERPDPRPRPLDPREACRQTQAWQAETGQAGLTISINLSGRQIADPDLVADVRASCRRPGSTHER